MSIDTTCSSGLVAVNIGYEMINRGELESSLIGGVNSIISGEVICNLIKSGMLSSNGRCKTFDKSADGYGRSEACVVLYIGKEDKEYRNEYIKISSIGINQDGKSNGITAPNGPSQVKLLNRVKNNTDINKIDYIEAHGTGTSLGDPIEIRSICKVYSSSEDDTASVIGTSKSQVGHSESTAGLVALMKVMYEE